jgi:hypothetical protein
MAIVVSQHRVAFVLVLVAIIVPVSWLTTAMVSIRPLVLAGSPHAWTTRSAVGDNVCPELVIVGKHAIIDILASLDDIPSVFLSTHCPRVRVLFHREAHACAGETRVAPAVVAPRVVEACGLVVALMNPHHAFVPVRATGRATPASDAIAREAESPAVIARATVGARRELAVVSIDAASSGDTVASPTSIAGALI